MSCGCIVKEKLEKVKNNGIVDMNGKKCGKWTVLKYSGDGNWLCRCECGFEKEHKTSNLNIMTPESSCRECYKTKINKNFFKNIDTQEKAYILGFFYADGCNYEDSYRVKIDLA